MHGLHNAALIRQALPRRFSKPIPYLEDRKAKHREYAAAANQLTIAKRAEITAKAKATRAKNKAAADASVTVSDNTETVAA